MTKHEHEKREATKSRYIESRQGGDSIQRKIFKSMSPAQKLNTALSLYYSARELKAAGLREQNLGWSEEMIQEKLREIFLYART